MMPNQLDQVTLVNSQDDVIGQMDKIEAHRGEAKLHRAISVYLFRKSNTEHRIPSIELLIQQRSDKKIVGAGQWANTVCGNVRPGESYEACAYRRLTEELGITEMKLDPLHKFEYHLQCNAEFSEWEMDQVYAGWYEGEVNPNPDEAQDFEWVSWQDLVNRTQSSEFGEFKTKHIHLDNLKSENWNLQSTLPLAPWFVGMLGDEKLVKKLEIFIKNKKGKYVK